MRISFAEKFNKVDVQQEPEATVSKERVVEVTDVTADDAQGSEDTVGKMKSVKRTRKN